MRYWVQILLIPERDDDHSDLSYKSDFQGIKLRHNSGLGEMKVFEKDSEDSLAHCDI